MNEDEKKKLGKNLDQLMKKLNGELTEAEGRMGEVNTIKKAPAFRDWVISELKRGDLLEPIPYGSADDLIDDFSRYSEFKIRFLGLSSP